MSSPYQNMSGPFNLPRDPADFRPKTPLAADGTNPFAESGPATAASEVGSEVGSDDPFTPPAKSEGPAYQPHSFETTIPHRGGTVLALGWLSLGLPALGLVMLAIYAMTRGIELAIMFSPALILSLICSLPAWIMSSLDMKAIQAGAMQPEGRRQTLLGGWLGVAGTFLALLLGLPAIVYAIMYIFLEIQNL